MSENWAKWEKELVNGVFPLQRCVSLSDHSAVFLTEHTALAPPQSALLKLVPAIPTLRQTQLAQWTAAAGLAHPHLVRLLESGHCELGGLQFLFVVMQYAQQSLGNILSQRAIAPQALQKSCAPSSPRSASCTPRTWSMAASSLRTSCSSIISCNWPVTACGRTVRPRPASRQLRCTIPRSRRTAAFPVPAISGVSAYSWSRLPPATVPASAVTAATTPPAVAVLAHEEPAPGTPQDAAPASSDPVESTALATPSSVLHEEAPVVTPSALATVHGHIKLGVRVTVDGSGTVVYAALSNHSPSRYFTRVALETARKWKFVATEDQRARRWLLRFEFTRERATAHATGLQT